MESFKEYLLKEAALNRIIYKVCNTGNTLIFLKMAKPEKKANMKTTLRMESLLIIFTMEN